MKVYHVRGVIQEGGPFGAALADVSDERIAEQLKQNLLQNYDFQGVEVYITGIHVSLELSQEDEPWLVRIWRETLEKGREPVTVFGLGFILVVKSVHDDMMVL